MMMKKLPFEQKPLSTKPCIYCAIVRLLEEHDFEQQPNGDMVRYRTNWYYIYNK